jgi:hypothetical protein
MSKIPKAGIVIDRRMGIDDSGLANLRVDPNHRQRHDRRTRAYNVTAP